MTPPAAATAPARTRTRRTPPPARRTSGAVRPRAAAHPGVASPPPLALRLGGAVSGLAEHRLLERIIRGRAWIAIVGIGLIGIVFMQVSMLRMNAGIGRAVDTASQLERQNAALRATISEQSSGDHIEAAAARMGLILPTATPRFLDARGFDPTRAARSITQPGAFTTGEDASSTGTGDVTAAALAPTGVAPSPDAAATPPASATATATPSTSSAAATPTGSTTSSTSTSTSTSSSSSSSTTTATPSSDTSTSTATPAATPPPPSATGGASPTPSGR
jgi:hypothetical protein